MALIPASHVKPMPEDDKWKEAKRLLPLIKYNLPKNKEFAIYTELRNLELREDDLFILNQVQEEISQLLVRSGLYEFYPPDNRYWLKRVPVSEDFELKHQILEFLYNLHLEFFRRALSHELNIDIYKLDYLTEDMKNDGAINKTDSSSKEGKNYIISISDAGNGMYLNDYYLKSNDNGFKINVNNDFSKKISLEKNYGIVAQDSDLSGAIASLKIDTGSNTIPNKPKRSLLEILSWIVGILAGLILIYEFLIKK